MINPSHQAQDVFCMRTTYVLQARKKTLNEGENSFGDALDNLIPYYTKNKLRPNPDKAQLCAFLLRNTQVANYTLLGTAKIFERVRQWLSTFFMQRPILPPNLTLRPPSENYQSGT